MRHAVPLYQRPYVWRRAENDPENDRLGPFWDDVKQTVDLLVEHEQLLRQAGDPEKLGPMTPHFFGAVVIDQPEKVGGGVVVHEVIDGQQRLTTAQLLIAAASRACDLAGRPKHASRLRKLWTQDDDLELAGDERFKLRPTRYDIKAFASIMDPVKGDKLDTEVWSARFGDEWWRTLVKQGRYQRARAELFLMHWLTERTEAEVSATGLFVEFLKLFDPDEVPQDEVQTFIDAFIADAGTYRQFETLEAGSRERLFFARREVLDIGVVYPIALRLWRAREQRSIDHARLLAGLRALESWLVRRMVLGLTAQNYNRVMLEVLTAMGAAGDPVAGMIGHLRSYGEHTPTGWWPSDQRFRGQLVENLLYGAITQARVRMLLQAAEARLHTPKTEKIPLPPKLSIEHVIPQTWPDTWPLDDPDDELARERRVASIHRLGNLTLVTSSLNPALSNDPWTEKRAALAQHSALRLNAQLVHDNPEHFDEDVIDARGHALADLLIAEWLGPDAAEWA